MASQFDLDMPLAGMPSLRALKSFLAAARHRSFTAAAEALHVTPAAVSKQIRELEEFLGTELFVRSARVVTLTADGEMFKDAAQLSLINILQCADRLRRRQPVRQTLTVCCSPAFSSLWLPERLPAFFEAHQDIDLTVLATQNFIAMEAGVRPDVYVAKLASLREGYESEHLFDDEVYPVCTPQFLARHGPVETPQDLLGLPLLDISAYGRAQISEHIDWPVWLALQHVDAHGRSDTARQPYISNDYAALVQMTLAHQGVALGWHHLVGHLVERGALVRPVPQKVVMNHRGHYLSIRKDRTDAAACVTFCRWLRQQLQRLPPPGPSTKS
jgi:DNA-binding transcriptional LysR family regulator